jgi:hypothetical protein
MTMWRAMMAMLLFAPAAVAQDLPPALAAQQAGAVAALGEGYIARAREDWLIIACASCEGTPMVEIRLGRQEDETEGRLRSGQMTIGVLDQQCRGRNPSCRVEGADLGWVSAYRAGAIAGSTLVLLRDGAMVIVRSIAGSPEIARGNVERLRATVLPALVGP